MKTMERLKKSEVAARNASGTESEVMLSGRLLQCMTLRGNEELLKADVL